MLSLSDTNQWLNKQFEDGFICTTFKQTLARLWSKLITEQTLMQSIKFTGGVTWGRGFKEIVRNLWVTRSITSIDEKNPVFINSTLLLRHG